MNMNEVLCIAYSLNIPRQIDLHFLHLDTRKLQGNGFPLKLIGTFFKNVQCVLEHEQIILAHNNTSFSMKTMKVNGVFHFHSGSW